MSPSTALAATLLALNAVWIFLGLAALARVRRRLPAGPGSKGGEAAVPGGRTDPTSTSPRTRASSGTPRGSADSPPPISVLKPLAGADPGLEGALASFFEQDHPTYELVFGVEGADDPAVAVVTRLRKRYPHVQARLVIHEGGRGLNPKVSNLRAMLGEARHEHLLVSDSNVVVPRHYLRETSLLLDRPGTGLVTHLIAAAGATGTGALLEGLELDGTVAPAVAVAHGLCGQAAVVGKSMAFRRHDLARVGGLESVAHVLAEDYVLGRAFHAAGLRVDVAPTPVANWLGRGALLSAFRRLLRWGMIRVRLNPGLVALEPLQRPLVCAAIGFTAGLDPGWLLPWALALTLVRDIGARALLGERRIAIDVALGPVADGLALAAWLCAWFPRHVVWRGRRVRVAAGTRLYADAPMGSPGPVVVL